MQFLVPQNIDLEDKIVGPLTLKNFLILIFGGLFIYSFFFILPRGLAILLAVPLGLILVAMTVIRVQDQSFPTFIMHLIYFSLRPKNRTWNNKEPKPYVKLGGKIKKEAPPVYKQSVGQSEIEKLSNLVDTKGWMPIGTKSAEEVEDLKFGERVATQAPTKEERPLPDVLETPK